MVALVSDIRISKGYHDDGSFACSCCSCCFVVVVVVVVETSPLFPSRAALGRVVAVDLRDTMKEQIQLREEMYGMKCLTSLVISPRGLCSSLCMASGTSKGRGSLIYLLRRVCSRCSKAGHAGGLCASGYAQQSREQGGQGDYHRRRARGDIITRY